MRNNPTHLFQRSRLFHLQTYSLPQFFFLNKYYLRNGHTINGVYYGNLLGVFRKTIKTIHPEKLKNGILFYQDNVPASKSLVSMATVALKVLITILILLTLPPVIMFLNMKKHLGGDQDRSDDGDVSGPGRLITANSMPPTQNRPIRLCYNSTPAYSARKNSTKCKL